MRNLMRDAALVPARRAAGVREVCELYEDDDEWVKTSVSLRRGTRRRLRMRAAQDGTSIQAVIDAALTAYLD